MPKEVLLGFEVLLLLAVGLVRLTVGRPIYQLQQSISPSTAPEDYATSEPRILLRFIAGWGFDAGVVDDRDPIEVATEGAISMGGASGGGGGLGVPPSSCGRARIG